MSADQVARLLTDFDQQERPRGQSRVVPFDYAQLASSKSSSPARPMPMPMPIPVPEDDGYQRGRAEGYDSALAEYEQKLDYERLKAKTQWEQERHKLLNEIAATISQEISEAGQQLEAKIAGVTARILEPLIAGAVQKQAMATFVEKLSAIASDSRRPALRVTGPSDLLELVRSKLGVRAIAVELRADPALTEVSVVIDEVVLESQMKIWADRLKFAVLA